MSLTVEGAFDSQTLAANCRSALRRMLFILVPAATLVALIARPALSLYGPSYAPTARRSWSSWPWPRCPRC